MEKYGFVYIWFDKKHKRYYIGCRWGREDDGYICSSMVMNKSYKRRPQDFKRRILKTDINDRKQLLEEEYAWLKLIKKEKLGKKYYNLQNHHFGHWSNADNSLTIKEKIKQTKTGQMHSILTKEKMRKPKSEVHKEKIKQHIINMWQDSSHKEKMRQQIIDRWKDPIFREKMRQSAKKRWVEFRNKNS